MNKQQIKKYFYAKGVLAGIILQNIILIFFLTMISSKDGFEFLGLVPIWFLVITFSLASVVYFYLADKEVSK
jgi:ABC-type polysaccharide/polyol phosphate export permease